MSMGVGGDEVMNRGLPLNWVTWLWDQMPKIHQLRTVIG